MKRGRKPSPVYEHLKRFLQRYPGASGKTGTELYNSLCCYGERYGKITAANLSTARCKYRSVIELERTDSRLERKGEALGFIISNTDVSDPKEMKKFLKSELEIGYCLTYVKALMVGEGVFKSSHELRNDFIKQNLEITDPEEMAAKMKEEVGKAYHPLYLAKKMREHGIDVPDGRGMEKQVPDRFFYDSLLADQSADASELAKTWNTEHPEDTVNGKYMKSRLIQLGLGKKLKPCGLYVWGHQFRNVDDIKRLCFAELGMVISTKYIERTLKTAGRECRYKRGYSKVLERLNPPGMELAKIPNAFWKRVVENGLSRKKILSEITRGYNIEPQHLDTLLDTNYLDYVTRKAKERINAAESAKRKSAQESRNEGYGNPVPEYVPPLDAPEPEALKGVVTLPKLMKALIGSDGRMEAAQAACTARQVLQFFGFNDEILDNSLEKDDRTNFYMLEEMGLLRTEREETTLYDGKDWNISRWIMKKDDVLRKAGEYDSQAPQADLGTPKEKQ